MDLHILSDPVTDFLEVPQKGFFKVMFAVFWN